MIRAGLLQSTLILLPAEEKVATVFGGDTVDWVFDGGHVASRFIRIKPKIANSTTDIHIVSDHGNEYTLQLQESLERRRSSFRFQGFHHSRRQGGKGQACRAACLCSRRRVGQGEAGGRKRPRHKQANERKAEETKAEQYRSQYPGQLHFDYTWDQKKGKELGLQQIWRDDKFTYLRGQFQETPALYELKDGKGSLINFDFNDGLYTVPKSSTTAISPSANKRVEFHRTGGK